MMGLLLGVFWSFFLGERCGIRFWGLVMLELCSATTPSSGMFAREESVVPFHSVVHWAEDSPTGTLDGRT